VHVASLPSPVRNYLSSADLSGLEYFFAVGTHGGKPGKVGVYINKLQRSRGGRLLDEYFPLKMLLNTPKGVAPALPLQLCRSRSSSFAAPGNDNPHSQAGFS